MLHNIVQKNRLYYAIRSYKVHHFSNFLAVRRTCFEESISKHKSQSNRKTECITKIQSLWRGYRIRKNMKMKKDNYTFRILIMCLDKYIENLSFKNKVNALLSKRKKRSENFPSDISENIVKFTILKKYGILPRWDTDKGDLVIQLGTFFKRLEIKGFIRSGPSSFGPTEAWDILYFVDGQDIVHKRFKVYEIKLKNTSTIFRNMKMSKKETFGEIANSGRRPRGDFIKVIQPQLAQHCKLIFNGHISELEYLF